ncbi:hypothetical protein Bca4012_064849 [Brassica carinata]
MEISSTWSSPEVHDTRLRRREGESESDDVPDDVDGLLFDQIHRIIPTTLYDDSPVELFASSSSSNQNIATVTSFT